MRKQKVAREADLPDLIRFALGTGLRISEVCGIRICDLDLDLDGVPVVSGDDIRLVPIVAVRGKVCYIKGKGLVRSDTGQTSSALRIIPLPGFVNERLRARLTGDEDPLWPLFAAAGADGRPTFRWPANVRRSVPCGPHQGRTRVDDPAHLAAHLRHDPSRRIRAVGPAES